MVAPNRGPHHDAQGRCRTVAEAVGAAAEETEPSNSPAAPPPSEAAATSRAAATAALGGSTSPHHIRQHADGAPPSPGASRSSHGRSGHSKRRSGQHPCGSGRQPWPARRSTTTKSMPRRRIEHGRRKIVGEMGMGGPAAALLAVHQASGGQLWRRQGPGMRAPGLGPAGGGAARAAQRERRGGEPLLKEDSNF
nr:unnamed protein product [Digitaria exilis]